MPASGQDPVVTQYKAEEQVSAWGEWTCSSFKSWSRDRVSMWDKRSHFAMLADCGTVYDAVNFE